MTSLAQNCFQSPIRPFKKMGQPRPLYHLFLVLSNKHHYNFTKKLYEKCPSSIQRQDSNPQTFEHESPPITARPGLQTTLLISIFLQKLEYLRFILVFTSYFQNQISFLKTNSSICRRDKYNLFSLN